MPRVELFARQKSEGWDCWGNQIESDIEVEEVPETLPGPLRYVGGKAKHVKSILSRLPKRHPKWFVDPFVGGGSVPLYAAQMNYADHYYVSDAFLPLVKFWGCARNANEELVNRLLEIRGLCKTKEDIRWFYDAIKCAVPVDSVAAAVIFFVQNRCTFSGSTLSGGFSPSAAQDRFTVSSIERIRDLEAVLQKWTMAPADYRDVIKSFKKAGKSDAVWFLDPPYLSASGLYGDKGDMHNSFDHELLASDLKALKSPWLMTLDDCPQTRKLYDFANIEPWELKYSAGKSKIGRELFISNY